MDQAGAIRRLIDDADHVLVLSHASPDGDCLGAMLALGLALDQLGRRRTLVLPDPPPRSLAFLPGLREILVAPPALPPADLAIIPDCSELARLGPIYEAHAGVLAGLPIVNIDHHVSNRRFGAVNLVDPSAAAACEQLFFLFAELGVQLDQSIATFLLTGLVTDTQTFRTPNTTPRTMRVATALMEAGAPLSKIADSVYNRVPLATLRLWGLALVELREADGVIWTRLNEEMLARSGATWEESERLVNLLSSVGAGEVAILFKEMPDGTIRLSLRSMGRLNVAAIAAEFGGGGHPGAAGCTVPGPYEAATAHVIPRVLELAAGEQCRV
jgi:phosphoesterase RecJ-like protein